MAQVFISHSKRDTGLVDYFDHIIASEKVNRIAMEYEDLRTAPGMSIYGNVASSDALFLLLGPNVNFSEYTENWIGYEIGLATALNKQIYVFEPIDANIPFPVPHLNHYMLFNQSVGEHFSYIRNIVHQYTLFPFQRRLTTTLPITCPYDDCQSFYYLHTDVEQFNCPSCRRVVSINKQPKPPSAT